MRSELPRLPPAGRAEVGESGETFVAMSGMVVLDGGAGLRASGPAGFSLGAPTTF